MEATFSALIHPHPQYLEVLPYFYYFLSRSWKIHARGTKQSPTELAESPHSHQETICCTWLHLSYIHNAPPALNTQEHFRKFEQLIWCTACIQTAPPWHTTPLRIHVFLLTIFVLSACLVQPTNSDGSSSNQQLFDDRKYPRTRTAMPLHCWCCISCTL